MITQNKLQTQTRGRPRKQQTRTLAPIYKQIFSDNSAIIHTTFLIYVFQVFVETKSQKRVGHKDGGFTMYDKIDYQYCFDNFQQCLHEWRCQALLSNQNMRQFVRLLPALGPKIILRQICKLINYIVQCQKQGKTQRQILISLTHRDNEQKLNQQYPYMRFIPRALRQLRFDRSERWDRSNTLLEHIKNRVEYLWDPLLRIITHTVFNCIQGKIHNKYFKPFFSDADNPAQTYIGQLNLDQVVDTVLKQEKIQRSNRGSQANIQDQSIDRLRKVRSIVDNDGTRTVVQIIKAPEGTGGICLKQNQSLGLMMESPAKISRLQSEPLSFQGGSGFSSTAFKPQSFCKLAMEQEPRPKTFQSIFSRTQIKQTKRQAQEQYQSSSKNVIIKEQPKVQQKQQIKHEHKNQQQHKSQLIQQNPNPNPSSSFSSHPQLIQIVKKPVQESDPAIKKQRQNNQSDKQDQEQNQIDEEH